MKLMHPDSDMGLLEPVAEETFPSVFTEERGIFTLVIDGWDIQFTINEWNEANAEVQSYMNSYDGRMPK